MKKQLVFDSPRCLSIEVFQPQPNVFYSLNATEHLTGASRRSILIYCRAGLVQPVIQPPYGVMEFTEEAIYTVRRIEQIGRAHV